MPETAEAAIPAVSNDDKKRFATELLNRLKAIPDQHQQMWYFALVTSALDQTGRDIDKALEVADKAFAEKLDQVGKPEQQLTKSLRTLNRLNPSRSAFP